MSFDTTDGMKSGEDDVKKANSYRRFFSQVSLFVCYFTKTVAIQ